MKILVCPHHLQIGGLQLVAINLAAAVRDLGHEVVVCAPEGQLLDRVRALGLPFVPLHLPGRYLSNSSRPAPAAIRQLRELVRTDSFDLLHAYSRSASLEVYFGAHFPTGIPMITTVGGLFVPGPHARYVPLVLGTQQLRESARRAGNRNVLMMNTMPIDLTEIDPTIDISDFAGRLGIQHEAVNIVLVSRLARFMKLEGIETAIDAVAQIARELPVKLIVVGEGDAHDYLKNKAELINQEMGKTCVTLTGLLLDPRPAYATADIVLGMGTSVLRGMAFGKPAIVLGEKGYSEIVTPSSIDRIHEQGFYGLSNGARGPDQLVAQLMELATNSSLRQELGRFCRETVVSRFGLKPTAVSLVKLYEQTLRHRVPLIKRLPEAIRVGSHVALAKTRHRLVRQGTS